VADTGAALGDQLVELGAPVVGGGAIVDVGQPLAGDLAAVDAVEAGAGQPQPDAPQGGPGQATASERS